MAEKKTPNPDSVSLGDIGGMKPGEFRQWTFIRLNSIDEKLRGHDRRFDKLDSRIWMILATILVSILLVILTAVVK